MRPQRIALATPTALAVLAAILATAPEARAEPRNTVWLEDLNLRPPSRTEASLFYEFQAADAKAMEQGVDLFTLRLAAGSTEITLHISPTDHENLGPQIARLAETLCQLAPSSIVADADITPGGCRVVTKFGEVDQQIESQLRRIEEELA